MKNQELIKKESVELLIPKIDKFLRYYGKFSLIHEKIKKDVLTLHLAKLKDLEREEILTKIHETIQKDVSY